MVCHGCTFTQCLGMDCPELANAAVTIHLAANGLHTSNNLKSISQDNGAGNNVSLPNATSSPKLAEERQ